MIKDMPAVFIFALIVCMEVGLSLVFRGVVCQAILRKRGSRREGKESLGGGEGGHCKLGISERNSFTLTSPTVLIDWLGGPCELARKSTWVVCLLHTSICVPQFLWLQETTDYRDGSDTPITGQTESGCGLWLQGPRTDLVTLTNRVGSNSWNLWLWLRRLGEQSLWPV